MPRHPPYALKNLTLHALHANCRTNLIRGSPEDARVHCVVLKIRTEPCIADLHPETRDDKPFEVAPYESSCFLRTQQRARHSSFPLNPRSAAPRSGHLLTGT